MLGRTFDVVKDSDTPLEIELEDIEQRMTIDPCVLFLR